MADAVQKSIRRSRTIRARVPLERLWRLFRGRCAYCGRQLELAEATRDHVVPRDAGGGVRRNLVLACEPCNKGKGAAPEGEGFHLTPEAREILAKLM